MPRYALRFLGHRPGASLGYFTGAGVTLTPGDVFPIESQVVTLGRRATADLRVASSSVAPAHARVWVEDGAPYVVDMRSTNGTHVGDARVLTEPVMLVIGDRLTLAGWFDFEVIDRDQAAIRS